MRQTHSLLRWRSPGKLLQSPECRCAVVSAVGESSSLVRHSLDQEETAELAGMRCWHSFLPGMAEDHIDRRSFPALVFQGNPVVGSPWDIAGHSAMLTSLRWHPGRNHFAAAVQADWEVSDLEASDYWPEFAALCYTNWVEAAYRNCTPIQKMAYLHCMSEVTHCVELLLYSRLVVLAV